MSDSLYLILTLLPASLLQGTAGFGFALLAVPLLSLFMPLSEVVPVIVILSTVTNLLVAGERRKSLRVRDITPLLIAGILGIPLGVRLLHGMNPDILKIAVGILIIGTAAAMLRNWKVHFTRKNVSFVTAGFLSGLLGGSLSMSGPPIIIFLTNEGYDRDSFRANLTFYGIVTNLAAIITFGIGGMLTPAVWKAVGLGILPLFIGSAAGIFLSGRIDETSFKRIVLLLLILMSAVTVAKGIFEILPIGM